MICSVHTRLHRIKRFAFLKIRKTPMLTCLIFRLFQILSYVKFKKHTWIPPPLLEFSNSNHCSASTLWFCWLCHQPPTGSNAIVFGCKNFFWKTLNAMLAMVTHSVVGSTPVSFSRFFKPLLYIYFLEHIYSVLICCFKSLVVFLM